MRHNQPKDFQIAPDRPNPRSSPVPDPVLTPTTENKSQSPPQNKRPLAFAPQFAIGYTILTLLRMLNQNRAKLSPRHIPGVLIATAISAASLPLKILSDLIYSRRVNQTEINLAPIFVLGHWRSGTTYLHELLSADERNASPNGYQCFVPAHFLLSQSWLKPLIGLLLPEKRPMDDMELSLDRPQEDEFAMLLLTGRSTYRWTVFPHSGPVDLDYITLRNIETDARAKWIDTWIYFLKSVAFRAGPNKRLVLKTPQHTARIRTILETFPQAKFVHIARNPLTVYRSTLRTWRAVMTMHGDKNEHVIDHWIEESVLETGERIYQAYEDDRELIPKGNLIELNFEDLVKDPKSQLRNIYATLNLGDFSFAEPAIDERLAESRDYKTGTASEIHPRTHDIARRWSHYITRFGYGDVVEKALNKEE